MRKNDFTQGSVIKTIIHLAIPMTLAQLINVLYNVIDRMYIGRIGEGATLALSGIGLTFPIIMCITAFANLFGMGGAPLCSIERGKQNDKQAERIMSNSYSMLLLSGFILMLIVFLFKNDILFAFGASKHTFQYADDYITIYVLGTIFVMLSLGMNSFINAQGFAKQGMLTVLIGAILNIILDPICIFGLDLGVKGAALATIISQFVSCLWTLYFLSGKESILHLDLRKIVFDLKIIKDIVALGLSGFVMSITNSIVQVVCNFTLSQYGGDLYIGVMTILHSVREIVSMPVNGITNASQPVMSYNYGAKEMKRVKKAIRFMSISCIVYTTIAWCIIYLFPEFFIALFNKDATLLVKSTEALHIYFFGFFMMSLQFSGQSVFVALNKPKKAVFFSLFRKIVIVVPLTLLLPTIHHLGVNGVFLAEPISNFIGGAACYITMLFMIRKIKNVEMKSS